MSWLNYHHLLYFWTVAREGSIARACDVLHLTQPTVSEQIRLLERAMKVRLFERSGRGLVLTEAGRLVYRYADEIFALGRDLQDALHDRPRGQPLRFAVGVADTLPKLLVHRLLAPAFAVEEEVQITCVDGAPDRLLAELALHELDLVVSDFPAPPRLGMKAFNHLLGDCGVTFFATAALARRHRRGFPRSLTGAPLLIPAGNTTLRRSLERWFDAHDIHPRIRGEFADSALLKAFGGFGEGIFAAPTVVEAEVKRMYGVEVVGRERALREQFYAISVEKRIKHPAVLAITQTARDAMFKPARGT
jgi:LysR family transcriptional activator of nhaA